MSNFLQRLAARSFGTAEAARPSLAPLFATHREVRSPSQNSFLEDEIQSESSVPQTPTQTGSSASEGANLGRFDSPVSCADSAQRPHSQRDDSEKAGFPNQIAPIVETRMRGMSPVQQKPCSAQAVPANAGSAAREPAEDDLRSQDEATRGTLATGSTRQRGPQEVEGAVEAEKISLQMHQSFSDAGRSQRAARAGSAARERAEDNLRSQEEAIREATATGVPRRKTPQHADGADEPSTSVPEGRTREEIRMRPRFAEIPFAITSTNTTPSVPSMGGTHAVPSSSEPAGSEPAIQVTIGRMEVLVAPQDNQRTRAAHSSRPQVSLEEYLRRRGGAADR